MRLKVIACLAFIVLLAIAQAASASLTGLTFPATGPVSGAGGADMGKVVSLLGDVVKFSNGEVASHGASPPVASFPAITGKIKAIPAPDVLMSLLAPKTGISQVPRDSIYRMLVGTNLTYSSFAGKPMNYTIKADDIKGINRTAYKGDLAWKVHVGEGLAWDLIMDGSGTRVLDTRQLFRT